MSEIRADFPFPPPQRLTLESIDRARKRLGEFIGALESRRRSMDFFSAQIETPQEDDRYRWLSEVRYDGELLHGVNADRQSGEQEREHFAAEDVVDWFYAHNHRLIGGFSFRDEIMYYAEYSDCLTRDLPLPHRKMTEDEYHYFTKIERCCLPFDEEDRRHPLYALLDAIGNFEIDLTRHLLSDKSLVNAWGEVAINHATVIDRELVTPLLYALEVGNEDAAVLCIKAGAPLDLRTRWHLAPIHLASIGGHLDVLRLLLDEGAELQARDNHGNTPLCLATVNCRHACMRLLIERGADVNYYYENIREVDGKMTGVVSPALAGRLDLEAAKILHEAGATFDQKDDEGEMALHIAARNGAFDVAEFLLKIGCDANAKTKDGRTCSMVAMEQPRDGAAAARFARLCEQYDRE